MTSSRMPSLPATLNTVVRPPSPHQTYPQKFGFVRGSQVAFSPRHHIDIDDDCEHDVSLPDIDSSNTGRRKSAALGGRGIRIEAIDRGLAVSNEEVSSLKVYELGFERSLVSPTSERLPFVDLAKSRHLDGNQSQESTRIQHRPVWAASERLPALIRFNVQYRSQTLNGNGSKEKGKRRLQTRSAVILKSVTAQQRDKHIEENEGKIKYQPLYCSENDRRDDVALAGSPEGGRVDDGIFGRNRARIHASADGVYELWVGEVMSAEGR
ncbi:hypothetical protein EDD85DRAFT_797338 [Armillaria nabsnona]|nr:hypothetical protein EDD85DRAFT_797335 [Armillaria nabsnona]KAK0219444.1 hypothetical protein EDD85DRAFT_797338 [Armillaria nabsnona]